MDYTPPPIHSYYISPMLTKMSTSFKPYILCFTIFILCTFAIPLVDVEATKLGFTVDLIHRDSPKSPFHDNSTTPFQKMYKALRRSAKRLNNFFPNAETNIDDGDDDDDDPESDMFIIGREFIMTYSLGTPEHKTHGSIDTGSDLIWLQCKPCVSCFEQHIALFDPSTSFTYRDVKCDSDQCKSAELSVAEVFCDSDICQYKQIYADGTTSVGSLSHDTLTLGTTSGGKVTFPEVIFGCGHENVGKFSFLTSGIVGLGRGPLSLVSQISSPIEGKFSYCLVPSYEDDSGKLKFGQSAVLPGSDVVSTPLVLKRPEYFYFVTLEAMSVGDKRIEFTTGDKVEEGNIIIDSGTTATIVPQEFYSQLEAEVSAKLDQTPSLRVDDPTNTFSLCYSAERAEDVGAPTIVAHFRGADVQLDAIHTFIMMTSEVACFAFQPTSEGAIYGNVAQSNFMVGYDLHRNLVSFKPTDCTQLI